MSEFRQKHAEWVIAMRGDTNWPRNAIQWQAVELVDSAAWYRVVLRSRELCRDGGRDSNALNYAFHEWIDMTFIESFLVRVRRLAGGANDSLVGSRSCYSLQALITDVQSHSHLLTRENLLQLDGLPFDLLESQRKQDAYLREVGFGEKWKAIPFSLDFRRGRIRNTEIDYLCGVEEATRALQDTVGHHVFTHLRQRLARVSDITLYVDKIIAHASTLHSRSNPRRGDVEQVTIMIADLWEALEQLCRCVAELDGWFINRTGHAFLPSMSPHDWSGIDLPLVEPHHVAQLEELWETLEREAQCWGNPRIGS